MNAIIVYSATTGEPITAIRLKDHELQAMSGGAQLVIPIAVDRTPMLVENNGIGLLPTPAWTHLTLVLRNVGDVMYLLCNDDELARGLPAVWLPGQQDPKPWP